MELIRGSSVRVAVSLSNEEAPEGEVIMILINAARVRLRLLT